MSDANYILATAGHVDHGKSAIVRALTGVDPDRLPEEKARGITIDLGFAHLRLPGMTVGIVDVPGHEDFVKNMVAGVGAADAALLVVAADDGWMPQTEEHAQILAYAGVNRAVVALTKIDLVADSAIAIRLVRERLQGTPFADAPVVPTSIRSGSGLDALREAIAAQLRRTPPRADVCKPRLAVDRAFSPRGVGTVVTGTLVGGAIARDAALVVRPAGLPTRARALQRDRGDVPAAGPGSRVAIQLADVGCDPDDPRSVRRGDVVTVEGVGRVSAVIDVELRLDRRASLPLRHGVEVRLHHATQSRVARVKLLGRRELAPGERGVARLTLDRPAHAMLGDRLIIRSASERATLAGGVVLDASPPGGRRGALRPGSPQAIALEAIASAGDVSAVVAAFAARDGWLDLRSLFEVLDVERASFDAAVDRLVAGGAIVQLAGRAASASVRRRLADVASELVDRHHAAHPERRGLAIDALRAALAREAAKLGVPGDRTELAERVIEALAGGDFERAGASIARASHRPLLPPRLQAAGEACRRRLAERPFDPPSRKELCATDLATQALKFLIATGEATEVGPDLVLSSTALGRAASIVREHLARSGPATVSELKTLLGSSRRVMVPLLERLDRDGVTRRVGDRRELAKNPST